MTLKEIRQFNNLTQIDAAKVLNISVRSYKDYENKENKHNSPKYKVLCEMLKNYTQVDEEHGILKFSNIKILVSEVLKNYDVNFCYLFGSYAKNKATDFSDVDLLIDTSVTGLKFYGLVEELREKLCKKVDLLDLNQLENNIELTREILKDGIKIYG